MTQGLPTRPNPAVLLQGDAVEVLRGLPDGSVHSCVTSPPYWGLRDYGVAGQLGLEKTPAEYVAAMVAVFREVKRVLRNDGTLWLNIGDSYNAYNGNRGESKSLSGNGQPHPIHARGLQTSTLKPKDLVGIPWRLAFALQADGWYLRSDVIWHKPNAMPESVTDRPSKAHEYLFLFSKRARYFYDGEAIKEESNTYGRQNTNGLSPKSAAKQDLGHFSHKTGLVDPYAYPTRNRRSVWSIVSDPYPEAHFATFPPALVEPCVRAGTSLHGCCPACWGPWKRVVEKEKTGRGPTASQLEDGIHARSSSLSLAQKRQAYRANGSEGPPPTRTTGWQPSCRCDRPDVQPCVVLDPFCGSGTTLQVALQLDRWGIGIDLNADYLKLAEKRIREPAGIGGLFDPKRPEMVDLFV